MKKRVLFHSTIVRIIVVIIVMVLPINIITLVLSNRVLKSGREQMAIEIQNTLDTNTGTLESILKRASKKLVYTSLSESEFMELAHKSMDKSTKAGYLNAVRRQISNIKLDYEWIDLIYVRFPLNEITMMEGFPGIKLQSCREMVINESDAIQALEDGQRRWQWELDILEGQPVLFGIRNWNNTDVGCIINLDRLLRKMNLSEPSAGRTVFFTNSEGSICTATGEELLHNQGKTLEELEKDSRYGVFYSSLENYDICLVEVVEWNKQSSGLPTYIVFMQFLSILSAILVLPVLLIAVRRWVGRPLTSLTRAIDQVEQGKLDYRIQTIDRGQGKEFQQINQNFNHMMEQVRELKIDVYEKELEQNKIRMKYLSQQIQPHFILNAMNILYSYEPEEYELSQKMIQCISKYFRYIVKANDKFVELGQEMDHIQNYLEIQKARFPELFFAIVEYDESLSHALIPPLLLQNFVENAIKHSLKIGNNIAIYVIGEKVVQDEVTKMRIRIADTGKGITDEILEQIQNYQKTGIKQQNLGVGITNAIERLKHLYGGRGTVRIERDSHYNGTNVEIVLPVFYGYEGEEYHENISDR